MARLLLVFFLACSVGACSHGNGFAGQGNDTGGGDNGGGDNGGGDNGGGDNGGGDNGGGDNGGGDGSSGDARACYNPEQGEIGTRVVMVIRSTDSSSGLVLTTTSDTLVNRETTFNGHDVLESVSDVDADASNNTFDSHSTTKSYYTMDDAHFSIHSFGGVTETTSPFASTNTITIDPEQLKSFDLDENGSYDEDYTVHTQSNIAPFPLPDNHVVSTTTYEGRESVTVPAGTFETCKMTEEGTSTVSGNSSDTSTTTWWAVDTGLLVKQVSGNTTSELMSATINGQSVK